MERAGALLSLGIATEWSFDNDFLLRRPRAFYIACDRGSGTLVHLVAALRQLLQLKNYGAAWSSLKKALRFLRHVPPWNARRRFVRKWVRATVVDPKRDVRLERLLDSLSDSQPVFLKMDIEGGEYELIPEIVRRESAQRGYFSGLCFEIHDIGSRETEFFRLINQLTQEFSIVHIHANNCAPLIRDFPDVIEITLVPHSDVTGGNVWQFPRAGLDAPNNPNNADFALMFD
jgi:hypothetical protein